MWVIAVSKQHEACVLQPVPSPYDQRQLTLVNGVVSVEPDKLFEVLVANIVQTPQRLVKQPILLEPCCHI